MALCGPPRGRGHARQRVTNAVARHCASNRRVDAEFWLRMRLPSLCRSRLEGNGVVRFERSFSAFEHSPRKGKSRRCGIHINILQYSYLIKMMQSYYVLIIQCYEFTQELLVRQGLIFLIIKRKASNSI